jgi:basic amino acid/polyamine antiporter, APA family
MPRLGQAPKAPGTTVAPIRALGRLHLVSVGLNSVIGGGIFILPAMVAALLGPLSIAAYLAAGLVVLGIGAALGSLAARFDTSGGPYLYVRGVFGSFAGFQVGWLFCLARLTAMANLLNGAALYLGALLPALAQPWPRAAIILMFAAVVIGLNVAGVRQTSGAADVLAILKVLPLLLIGVAGLFLLQPERLIPHAAPPAAFLRAVLLLCYAFTGFEILTVPAEESKAPRRDMPFALRATIGIVCALYLLVQVSATGGLPSLGTETAPLASLASLLCGGVGRVSMTAIAALSMIGCSLMSLFGATRLLYAMSKAREIPPFLGALDPKRRTPALAAILTGTIGAALAIFGGFAFLAAVSSGTRLLIYLACCLASAVAAGSPRPRAIAWPLLTAVAIAVLLTRLERREVVFGMMGVCAGTGLYLIARPGRRGLMTHRETT